jgi:carbonic anhydrase
MDPRLSNLPEILGQAHADIDVIRTGGPAVTADVLGELVVSKRILGTTESTVLNHTGISKDVPVRGFVLDMETGLLGEVQAVLQQTAA